MFVDSHSKHAQAGTFDDLKNELRLDEEDWSSHPSSGVPSIPSHTSSLENGVNGQVSGMSKVKKTSRSS